MEAGLEQKYSLDVVRWFTIMATVYLVVGASVGVYIASELAWPFLNFDSPYISFGRLRPVHTNAVIFAFGGCTLMATAFYTVQRTCGVRVWSEKLAWFVFWGWNAVIVLAVITLPLGLTESKEYAELEWPIDILIAVVWLAFTFNFIMTLAIRKSSHIYVSNWFFLGMMVMIVYLHVVNSLAIPVGLFKSYSLFSGVQDAMIQWWWGHNAVGFYLTAGFLGIMYYFVPKQANRPIYSYRLSVIHFWALMFGYVWLGAHHLQYTALPDWTGSLGAAVSIAMIIPSWGGAVNGMMTLSGAWDRLRTDYVLRFLIMALAFYAMSTFEGPVMSLKTVNALSHYTDWTDRSCPFRGIGLGRRHLHRGYLSLDDAPLPYRDVVRASGQFPLLDRHHRHRGLYRRHVGVRHHARSDVARLRRVRHPGLYLRGVRGRHAPLLRHAGDRRHDLPFWRGGDAVQRADDRTQVCLARQPGEGAQRSGRSLIPELTTNG